MTTEELRRTIVAGIDGILEAPWIISRWISVEQRRLLRAQRSYWQQGDEAQLQRLLDLLNKEPFSEEEKQVQEGG